MPSQVAESGTDFFPLSPSISHQSMPPKRKADKGKQSQSKRSKADDEPTVDEKDNTSLDETNIASSSDNSNNDKNDAGSLNDKLQKFKELRRRRVSNPIRTFRWRLTLATIDRQLKLNKAIVVIATLSFNAAKRILDMKPSWNENAKKPRSFWRNR